MNKKPINEELKVAYLGPEGTFSQSAVFKQFGEAATGIPVSTIEEIFSKVEAGLADFAVIPVENSTEGVVANALDMFLTSPLYICGEVEVRIRQHLMGSMHDLKDIKRIYSHPQSLAQCRSWLSSELQDVEIIPTASNAVGASRALKEEGAAAIAGDIAARVYSLNIICSDIEDRPDNTTRFHVIGHNLCQSSNNDKTTFLIAPSGTEGPGVLLNLLEPLARYGINMTSIQSRPSRRRKWDYVFFVDIDGNADDINIKSALMEAQKISSFFRILGTYSKADS
ncbi:MAG: prephenate dehydratase [Candidatus Rariloculaceae bacterium]